MMSVSGYNLVTDQNSAYAFQTKMWVKRKQAAWERAAGTKVRGHGLLNAVVNSLEPAPLQDLKRGLVTQCCQD